MRLRISKYEWAVGTADIDINFYSPVEPFVVIPNIDLYDYYIKDTMGDISYTFEDIDGDNTLYTTTSSVTFDCINDIYDGITLIEHFGCYESNKYVKWKLDYYNDNDELIDKFILYKDGINIDSIEDQILSFTALGYEKEFKSYFDNVEIVAPTFTNLGSGINGLEYYSLPDVLKTNFNNVPFEFERNTASVVNQYKMAAKPFTYFPSTEFTDYGQVLHLKTGYACYYYDRINKFTFLNSLLLPMGWIWYFKLGELVIKERADTSLPITVIDFEEVFMDQSLEHNYNQFQLDNVVIKDGRYFDNDSNLSALHINKNYSLVGDTVHVYSKDNNYYNEVRPWRDFRIYATNRYQLNPWAGTTHTFTNLAGIDENNITVNTITIGRFNGGNDIEYNVSNKFTSYDVNKSLVLSPYVNSRDNSGGLDINNIFAETGAYYGFGNFFYAANLPTTDTMIFYNGSVANSIFKTVNGKYENYEQYARSPTFKKNFKKFLKTNDEVILKVDLKTEITNPQQRIQITNYPYANIADKVFNIVGLSYNERNKTTSLTLQMEYR